MKFFFKPRMDMGYCPVKILYIMSSLDALMTRRNLALGTVLQAGTDAPISFRIRKIGAETATSVTVTTATNIVLVGSTTTDTIAFATYTTIGSVVDAINATGRWEAKILDSLRSQASASKLVTGAITAGTDGNGIIVWDARNDTSTNLEIGVALSGYRDFDAPKGLRVELQEISYSVDMGTAAADSLQIYKRSGATEVKIFSALSVDTTVTTINFAAGQGLISGKSGEELFVRVKDAATLADAAGNFVRLTGRIW